MKNIILILALALTSTLAKAETGLEDLKIRELAQMADDCNMVRMRMLSAGLKANQEIVENTSFLAGFSRDSLARSLSAQARGQELLTDAAAGQSIAICSFVDKEMKVRLSK